jgi:hypothetical protein
MNGQLVTRGCVLVMGVVWAVSDLPLLGSLTCLAADVAVVDDERGLTASIKRDLIGANYITCPDNHEMCVSPYFSSRKL